MLAGTAFETARTQVENEILDVFHISGVAGPFDSMNLTALGEKNKTLLAVSAILQQGNTVGQLSELVSKINLDIKNDGTLDGAAEIAELQTNSASVNIAAVKANLVNRYAALGSNRNSRNI